MKRRRFLKVAGSATLLPLLGSHVPATSVAAPARRVRPSDPAWPGPALWEQLNQQVGGQLNVSEAGFFDTDWRRGYWGPNYRRLSAVKKRYDPNGLFFVHHGVGSEDWSADGFTRLAAR